MNAKLDRNNIGHNCDLFMLSSHKPYYAKESLTEFTILGQRNTDGWGLGSYENGSANVVRSSDAARAYGETNQEFRIAMNATCSSVMLGHLRLTSSGDSRVENNHPFKLHFLDYDWLLIHNGTASNKDKLVPDDERLLLDSDSDTPRVFEFMRRWIIDHYNKTPKQSLIEACRKAYIKLLAADSGSFNLILSNGYLSFAFIHWRSFYLLQREKQTGDVAILSTIKLSPKEEWIEFNHGTKNKARMLVFNGNTLVLNGDIPR